MRASVIIEKLQELAPRQYAMDWDNVGLLAGRADKEVKKIFVALEITDAVVEEAVGFGADMIVTHHPLIFKPVPSVTDQDMIGRRLVRMIQADISYYAMHTNFDSAPGCMAELAAERIGLISEAPLLAVTENGSCGIGKVGVMPEGEMTVRALAEKVKACFELPFVTVYGDMGQQSRMVRRIAISPGSGKSMISDALRAGADVLVTGDIGHHEGLDAGEMGLSIIDAGHYGLEHIFIPFMEGYLNEQFGTEVCVKAAKIQFPVYQI